VIELKVTGYESSRGEGLPTAASFSHMLKEVYVPEIRKQLHQDSVLFVGKQAFIPIHVPRDQGFR
jgi:hypothetical protein